MKIIDGGVTAPKGFKAASTAAGIKYQGREDMAMIYSEKVATFAGTFTSNVAKAAPVIWDRNILNTRGTAQAVVVNSGIANACTGKDGLEICRLTAEHTAKVLGIDANDVLVSSTGVIGMQLNIDKLNAGVDALATKLSDSREAAHNAEKAIMTTDTRPKEMAVEIDIDGVTVTIGAMTKGAGMIHPHMCTMLCYNMTDCDIDQKLLQKALSSIVGDTYNMISVDGDESTNDTCVVLANGMAGNKKITDENSAEYKTFFDALMYVNRELCKKMAGDGEGATALFEVVVEQAKNVEEAKTLAKSVVESSLVKAAIYGHDANWGRIICALGYCGVDFDPEAVDLKFVSKAGEIQIAKAGVTVDFDEAKATEILSADEITAVCTMHQGDACATAWGCDLTLDYVKINADYRS